MQQNCFSRLAPGTSTVVAHSTFFYDFFVWLPKHKHFTTHHYFFSFQSYPQYLLLILMV